MSRMFYHVMQDNVGNLLFDVSGTMRVGGSGTLATIYGDEGLSVILPNPMTNHPSYGSFKCFLGPGIYDFYMAKAGYSFETLSSLPGGGSMANQDANAVAITGGSATFTGAVQSNLGFSAPQNAADPAFGYYSNMAAGGSDRWFVYGGGTAPSRFGGTVRVDGTLGIGVAPVSNAGIHLQWAKGSQYGLQMRPNDSDTGNAAFQFLNLAGTGVGSITTTGAATAYNTTSDSRLKTAVDDLTGELGVIQALRPVSFRWLADDSPGVGFLAHEVAAQVQGVITGEEGAVDEHGGIAPQMIDYSKLVPYLVGAIKTLTARLVVLEDALGI